MDTKLHETALRLVQKGKGILAADESTRTCAKRFDALQIPCTEETRRIWRELLFTTPGIEKGLSGIILFDETIRQSASVGTPFVRVLNERGIEVGIKVDGGTVDLEGHPQEVITKGLDGLAERLKEYAQMGASFTKWRGVLRIGEGIPSRRCIDENAKIFAK